MVITSFSSKNNMSIEDLMSMDTIMSIEDAMNYDYQDYNVESNKFKCADKWLSSALKSIYTNLINSMLYNSVDNQYIIKCLLIDGIFNHLFEINIVNIKNICSYMMPYIIHYNRVYTLESNNKLDKTLYTYLCMQFVEYLNYQDDNLSLAFIPHKINNKFYMEVKFELFDDNYIYKYVILLYKIIYNNLVNTFDDIDEEHLIIYTNYLIKCKLYYDDNLSIKSTVYLPNELQNDKISPSFLYMLRKYFIKQLLLYTKNKIYENIINNLYIKISKCKRISGNLYINIYKDDILKNEINTYKKCLHL